MAAASSSPPIITKAASPEFDRLPYDLLEKIFATLCTGDRVRAWSVCKSWRDMLMRDNIPMPREAPWLILSDDSYSKPECTLTEIWFRSLSEQRNYRFTLPDGGFQGLGSHWCCCGSSGRWLLMGVWRRKPYYTHMLLWDPISGATRKLPAPFTLPFFKDLVSQGMVRISSFIKRSQVFSIGSVQCVAAVFASPEGVPGPCTQLVMCSMQDRFWTVFDPKERGRGGGQTQRPRRRREEEEEEVQYIYTDILFHKGKLYATCVSDRQVVNVNVTKTIHLTGCDVEVKLLGIDSAIEDNEAPNNSRVERLVESSTGRLLVVSTILDSHPDPDVNPGNQNVRCDCTKTRGFEVWQVARGGMKKVSDIGEQGIFVGATGSLSLQASVHAVEAGHIYFATDDASEMIRVRDNEHEEWDEKKMCIFREQGVFHMKQNRLQSISSTELCVQSGSFTGWFAPKLFHS